MISSPRTLVVLQNELLPDFLLLLDNQRWSLWLGAPSLPPRVCRGASGEKGRDWDEGGLERGLWAPGPRTLDPVQHSVVSLPAVPAAVGRWRGECILDLSEQARRAPTVPRDSSPCPSLDAGGLFGAQAVELEAAEARLVLGVTWAALPALGDRGTLLMVPARASCTCVM